MVNMDIKYNDFVQTELPSSRKTEQAKYFSDSVNKSLQTKEIRHSTRCIMKFLCATVENIYIYSMVKWLNLFGYMVWTVFI